MKLGLSDQAVRRIALLGKGAGPDPVDVVSFASDDEGNYFRVQWARFKALVELYPIDPSEPWEDAGEKIRTTPNDLQEFYTLYDINGKVVTGPHTYDVEDDAYQDSLNYEE